MKQSTSIQLQPEQQRTLQALGNSVLAQMLQNVCKELNVNAYPVGGCVREALLGNLPADGIPDDLDCLLVRNNISATSFSAAEKIARKISIKYDAAFVPLDPQFGTYRVVLHAGTDIVGYQLPNRIFLDLSDALNNDLEMDLARRDLTINALALDLKTGKLLDRFDGLEDLQTRKIKMISAKNLEEDPLRILRVFRFAAMLNSKEAASAYDSETLATAENFSSKLENVAAERIHEEFYKLISYPHAFDAIQKMAGIGLLEQLFAEMTPMRKIPPNGHHHLGLFEHTLELVRQAEILIGALPPEEQAYFTEPFENSSLTRFGLVKLACLFHDLGKPDTMESKETATGQRFTYYGHDQVSADLTSNICDRLKTGNAIKQALMHLTRWHLYPCQFGKQSPRKSVLRFYRRMGNLTPDIILLALADRHSTLGPDVTEAIVQREHENMLWLLENYQQEQANLKQPLLLNGNDLMRLLKLSPGPHLKDILNALQEAQQLGEVTSKAEAETWIFKNYSLTNQ